MSAALIAASVWALVATAIGLSPRRWHWPGAWTLIATGVPLLGWVTWDHGPWVGLAVLAGGMSVLRYPVLHLVRKTRRAI